jgi:hypothetical protein
MCSRTERDVGLQQLTSHSAVLTVEALVSRVQGLDTCPNPQNVLRSKVPEVKRDNEFNVVEVAHQEEAAAFVAALSRLLDSPAGRPFTTRQLLVEVWAASPDSEPVLLFLSKTALAAAESAFSPVLVERTVNRTALPAGSFRVIEGGKTPPWGLHDAAARLAHKHTDQIT